MARPLPPVPGVRHAFVDLPGGLRVHVAEAGDEDAPPVLLLHGWPQHWYLWREVIPVLAGSFRVLAPDLRGAGWSDVTPGGYDKEQLASDQLALLDALGVERLAGLAGHDWGGWVGQLVALRAPERVARLALANIAPVWGDRRAMARNAWRFGYQVVVGAPRLGPWVQRSPLLARAMDGVDAAAAREFGEALAEPGRAEAGSRLYRTLLLREVPALARGRYDRQRLTVPTRVIYGDRDPVIRPEMLRPWRRFADDLEVEVVPGAGHFVVDERPDLVAERLLAWFGS